MKKSLFLLFALLFAGAAASAQVKIVTVNVADCFESYYKSVDFRNQMSTVQENLRDEMREREAALQRDAEPLQLRVQEIQENPGLSDDAKREQLAALQPEVQQFRQREQDYQQWREQKLQEAQQQNQNLRRNLIDDIKRVAIDVGIREGAGLVLDTSDLLNSGVPTVLYSSTQLDITNKVINELNRDQPSE